jgi:adenylosuccinate lyase
MSREDAYQLVQENAHKAWNTENGDFRGNIFQDDRVTAILSPEEIDSCFDPNHHLENLNAIYTRLDI